MDADTWATEAVRAAARPAALSLAAGVERKARVVSATEVMRQEAVESQQLARRLRAEARKAER